MAAARSVDTMKKCLKWCLNYTPVVNLFLLSIGPVDTLNIMT